MALSVSGPLTGVRVRDEAQEAAPGGGCLPGDPRVGLLRLLWPRPLGPAGRAALWRARRLLNRDLHPIPLMETREQPLGHLELHAVAIRRTQFQRAFARIDALNGRRYAVPRLGTRRRAG